MDTANVPTVGLIQRLVVMEKPVTQIANNYITRHNTRRSRSKGRWVWVGSVLAVIGLLSFYGATKAKAETFEGKAAEEIVYRGEIVSETWVTSPKEEDYHLTRIKYKNRYYGCMSYAKWHSPNKGDYNLVIICATVP